MRPLPLKSIPDLAFLRAKFPSIKGIFFDMDGTLFNTESYHEEALLMIGSKYNIRPPYSPEKVFELMVGKADHLVYELVKSWENFPAHLSLKDFVTEKNRNLIDILRRKNLHDFLPPGIPKLLKEAVDAGFYTALITSSEKIITHELLMLTGTKDHFELVLTRDDCPHHKPHPWPYLKALETSALHQSEVLIFEDSAVGLEAALNSGAHVVKAEWFMRSV
jgi:beta-phosphoglucomutase